MTFDHNPAEVQSVQNLATYYLSNRMAQAPYGLFIASRHKCMSKHRIPSLTFVQRPLNQVDLFLVMEGTITLSC